MYKLLLIQEIPGEIEGMKEKENFLKNLLTVKLIQIFFSKESRVFFRSIIHKAANVNAK